MGRNIHCSSEERRIAKNLRRSGKSLREIAKLMNRSHNLVKNALKVQNKKETRGRPSKTTPELDRRILRIAKSDPFKPSRVIAAEIDNVINASSIRRRLQLAKLPGRIARKVPLMRPKNLIMRQNFAKDHITWAGSEGQKKWRNILFSDETKICQFGNDYCRNVRRPKGKEFDPRYTKKTVKHGDGNIMVWGCFSWYGVGPIFLISDIMRAADYKDILENIMLPYAEENMPLRWVFQHDNDPKHTSKIVRAWIKDNKVNTLAWPSQSPDLNPIENLWSELKKQIAKQKCNNKRQLWDCVQESWRKIPIETCQALIRSMPNRIQKVIKNKGGYTGY